MGLALIYYTAGHQVEAWKLVQVPARCSVPFGQGVRAALELLQCENSEYDVRYHWLGMSKPWTEAIFDELREAGNKEMVDQVVKVIKEFHRMHVVEEDEMLKEGSSGVLPQSMTWAADPERPD